MTYPRKSNTTTPATGPKDKRWQPSQGLLFGPAKIASGNDISVVGDRDFSTLARQPASLPIKPPPARPQQPWIRPYTTAQHKPVNLFMSEEDEDDSFGVDDEELGDILAQCLSCEDSTKVPSPAETQNVQNSQPIVEPTAMRKDPGRAKPPLTSMTASRKPPGEILAT